jgi:hypothetical protein
VYLNEHRGRTTYRKLRKGGYPLGSGGMESANKFIWLLCCVSLARNHAAFRGVVHETYSFSISCRLH